MTLHNHPARPGTGRLFLPSPPTLVLLLVAAGAASVIGLWWNDTATVRGTGDVLTNAGRLTGLLAGYGAAVLVLLMARIPWLERHLGADQLARWHAAGGRYTVCLILAHVPLIVWGYAVDAHTGVVHQAGTLLTSYPDMVTATIGAVLLVGVGVVSARAARATLPYEAWHLAHLATYVAIAAAFGHQLSTGAEFVTNPAAQLAWKALYGAAAAAIGWYRFVTPLRQTQRHRLRVLAVVAESADTVSVYIGGRHLEELEAAPGQFFRWRFLTPGLWWAANPYSLSAAPTGQQLRITVRMSGAHSAALAHLPVGTRVVTEGPYGAFTARRRTRRRVTLIAGGVGITPLRALFETLPAYPGELTLLYRARGPEALVLRSELEQIAADRGARLLYVTGSRAEYGGEPLTAANLLRAVPDLGSHDVYVCGPEPMAEAVAGQLRAAGVPRQHIHRESFEF